MPRFTRSPFFPIWVATGLLLVASPFLAAGSFTEASLLGMIPFAAILAVASAGQTIVIQQRGLDLSLPGMISLATVIVTKIPNGKNDLLAVAIVMVFVAAVIAGSINGLAITRFGITPLVATLGVNALLVGTVLFLTSGTSTAAAPMALSSFALARTFGIPNTALVAIVMIGTAAALIRFTTAGRRFVAVGANPHAAHVAGIAVNRYIWLTYVFAAVAYGVAGIMLTGFLGIPGALPGDNYLLPSIAAVVLGGTSLAGGTGSVVASGVGAVFLTQLQLLVRTLGAPQSVQLVLQGAIIAIGMGLRLVPWRRYAARPRPGTGTPVVAAVAGDGSPGPRTGGEGGGV